VVSFGPPVQDVTLLVNFEGHSSIAKPVRDHFYKMVKARGARSVGPGAPRPEPRRPVVVTSRGAPPPVTCHLSRAPVAHFDG